MLLRVRQTGVLLIVLLLAGCTPTAILDVDEEGDEAVLSTPQGSLQGELIAVTDSSLYVVISGGVVPFSTPILGRLVRVDAASISSIEIKGYSDKSWIGGVIAFEVVPALLMGIAAAQVDDGQGLEVTAVLMIPAALTALIFGVVTPPAPGAEAPWPDDALQELSKYARYPQGPSPDIMDALLESLQQPEVIEFSEALQRREA